MVSIPHPYITILWSCDYQISPRMPFKPLQNQTCKLHYETNHQIVRNRFSWMRSEYLTSHIYLPIKTSTSQQIPIWTESHCTNSILMSCIKGSVQLVWIIYCLCWNVVREKYCSGWKNKPNKPASFLAEHSQEQLFCKFPEFANQRGKKWACINHMEK